MIHLLDHQFIVLTEEKRAIHLMIVVEVDAETELKSDAQSYIYLIKSI